MKHHAQTVSLAEARDHLGEMIKRAQSGQEAIVVESDGVPMAVILSLPRYEQLLQESGLARFEHYSSAAGVEAEQQGLTEEDIEQEMEEIKQRLYQQIYG